MINEINNRQKAVARIVSQGEETKYGTGFLVDSDIMITAWHVISNNIDDCSKIKIIFEHTSYSFTVTQIIGESDILDIAIIKIDKHVSGVDYLKIACFPHNRIDICNPAIHYQILGYLCECDSGKQSSFWCFANSINTRGKWDLNLSFIQQVDNYLSLKGLSGAPLLLNDKIFGITIEQVNNFTGIPAGVISIYKIRNFLDINGIKYTVYDNFDMLDKNDIKDILLNEVISSIEKKYIKDNGVRKIVNLGSSYVVKKIRQLPIDEFIKLIESVTTTFNSSFEVSTNYQQYVNAFSEIIIQIALIFYSYGNRNIELSLKKCASIKINDDNYISYLFSEKYESYRSIIVQLFRYAISNPIVNLDKTGVILIGNEQYCECEDRCQNSYSGGKFDIDNIVNEITNPFWDDDTKQELSNIRDRFNDFKFHCKNCLKYDSCNSPEEISARIKNALGGV